MNTLNAAAAHNAVAAVVQLYAGVCADYERQLALLKNAVEAAEKKAAVAEAARLAVDDLTTKLREAHEENGRLRRELEKAMPQPASPMGAGRPGRLPGDD